jgi:3-hexulose-6-phosphate synthase/6-phospho-3-hexuloisomerase
MQKLQQPTLQLALDFLELHRAIKVAKEAVKGGSLWLEVGTPLIKSEGLNAVRILRKEFPKHYIVADLKTMDTGRLEVEAAAKAGANAAVVMIAGSEETVKEAVEAGKNYGIDIFVDIMGKEDIVSAAKKAEQLGASGICVHLPIDAQMLGKDPLEELKKIRPHVNIPIAVAGGINSETAAGCVLAGADIIIVGGAITKSTDAQMATKTILEAISKKQVVATTLYKRVDAENVRKIFEIVSTPNISDAMHRSGELLGFIQIVQGVKLIGQAITVRTYPGDWAKPVEAIDVAKKGDVIVIDAGGQPPAVWGELASESCIQRGIAGVIINGAIRDVDSIRALKFPSYAKIITPTAGEPKGFGEIGVAIKIGQIVIQQGDWIVADDNGIVRIPSNRVAEIANRAMDVYERENRIREEIRRKSTLAEVTELIKWEKKIVED